MATTNVVVETPAAAEEGATSTAISAATTTSTSSSEQHHEIVILSDHDEPMDVNGNDDKGVRGGSIASARFKILSTMVGGGILSLPLAFSKSGNGLVGPLCLILFGLLTDCGRVGAIASSPYHHSGQDLV
jgi:hypothetical protein